MGMPADLRAAYDALRVEGDERMLVYELADRMVRGLPWDLDRDRTRADVRRTLAAQRGSLRGLDAEQAVAHLAATIVKSLATRHDPSAFAWKPRPRIRGPVDEVLLRAAVIDGASPSTLSYLLVLPLAEVADRIDGALSHAGIAPANRPLCGKWNATRYPESVPPERRASALRHRHECRACQAGLRDEARVARRVAQYLPDAEPIFTDGLHATG